MARLIIGVLVRVGLRTCIRNWADKLDLEYARLCALDGGLGSEQDLGWARPECDRVPIRQGPREPGSLWGGDD